MAAVLSLLTCPERSKTFSDFFIIYKFNTDTCICSRCHSPNLMICKFSLCTPFMVDTIVQVRIDVDILGLYVIVQSYGKQM